MSLQVLGRLESLGAISIILGLIHLVDSVENHSRTSEADTSARNGNSDISLHGIAGRNTTIGRILANANERDTAAFQGLWKQGKARRAERKFVTVSIGLQRARKRRSEGGMPEMPQVRPISEVGER